ncbi:AAA family ATPase [uncultured Clostridium sp.]|uniref:AAA family ATPase n=1 Tax=uncultured Clostridium sp. TaxID=59620 RepID=UPI00345B99CC
MLKRTKFNSSFENYSNLYRSRYFIDKSSIIESLNEVLDTLDRYVCITKPRRFGKSSVADMLGAYYSKAVDLKEIFDNLMISQYSNYKKYLNKYNVIYILVKAIGLTLEPWMKWQNIYNWAASKRIENPEILLKI